MGVKVVATTTTSCLQWSSLAPHPSSSSPPLPSSKRSTSSSSSSAALSTTTRRSPSSIYNVSSSPPWLDQTPPFHGTGGIAGLLRSKSFESLGSTVYGGRRTHFLRRCASARSDGFFFSEEDQGKGDADDDDDDEFISKLQDLTIQTRAQQQQLSIGGGITAFSSSSSFDTTPPQWLDMGHQEPPPVVPAAGVEMNVAMNGGVEMPVSLRMIKKQKKKGVLMVKELAGEVACCSVERAFSSMVFIIREIHSFTLQLRELLFYEDLQGIVSQVHKEMHASFCWLFQQIFSCTPTLMVSVMLLLANFTVYSMAHNIPAMAAVHPPPPATQTSVEYQQRQQKATRFDVSSSIKTFSVGGRTASVGGAGGRGGSKARPVAGATDDWRYPSERRQGIVPGGEGMSTTEEKVSLEEEARAWRRVLEEAERMKGESRHEALMGEATLRRMVSPVRVEVESDEEYPEYQRTELMYELAVKEEPDNTLLLCNFAQFLHLVVHDHGRAEYYFKRAVEVKPVDAETLSRYANFLWVAKKDLCAAEETYLEAIAADPGNASLAANYANFLWSTGGEDTCFPVD